MYVDLATLKTALGITDSDRDVLLSQAIEAASASIDERCGRTFGRDEEPSPRVFSVRGRVVRQEDCTHLLMIDDVADLDGFKVETGGPGDWTEITGYETAPDNALSRGRPVTGLVRPFWSSVGKVRVTAVWGWPDVPAQIVQATLLQASRLYRRKDSPEGVAGSAEWGLVRVPSLDPDVRALVEPFRLTGFGGA